MAFFLGLILLLALVIAGLVFFTSSTAKKVEALLPPRGIEQDQSRQLARGRGGDDLALEAALGEQW